MDHVNLKKLAEQLDLSISTVSKAFRNSYDISEPTKNRILALARELNYQPNPLASSLRTQKSKTIAVIIPEIANNFFSLAINGIESVAQQQGYHVLIYLTHEDYAKEVAFTRHLQNGRVDGVLMSLSDGNKDSAHLEEMKERGIPVVYFDRILDSCSAPRITTNDFESGYKATTHLIDRGCQKIAHLYFSKNLSIDTKRKEGYVQALKDHGIPVRKKLMLVCSPNPEQSYRQILGMLGDQKPDGIFSSFEKLAVQTYQACGELQLSIPRKIKVISFSNLETASLLNPSLTTITQPAFNIGKEAATILFKALDKNKLHINNEKIVLGSALMVRDSTRKD